MTHFEKLSFSSGGNLPQPKDEKNQMDFQMPKFMLNL